MLQYLVRLVGQNDKELLNFKEDIISSKKAENVMLDSLVGEIKGFKEEFASIKIIATADGDSRRGKDGKIVALGTKITLNELMEQKTIVREVNGMKNYNQMTSAVEYTQMEIFFENAEAKIQAMCKQMEVTQKKFVELLKYFGEDEKMTSTDFFGTLNKFIDSFKGAKEYVEQQADMKVRNIHIQITPFLYNLFFLSKLIHLVNSHHMNS